MAYGTLYLQPKWFSESFPVNPKKASATLTFTGNVANNETVTIGTTVFEFKTTGNATTGRVKVDVSEGVTPAIAAAELVDTITATLTNVTAVVDEDNDGNAIVVVTAADVGTEGNAIAVAETCENATWGEEVTTLLGGQYGTPCIMKNIVIKGTEYYYWCEKEGGKLTVSWKKFIPAPY